MIGSANPPHTSGQRQPVKDNMEPDNMKKISKAILMAALGLACVPSVKASSGFDLVAGFTTGAGSDDLIRPWAGCECPWLYDGHLLWRNMGFDHGFRLRF